MLNNPTNYRSHSKTGVSDARGQLGEDRQDHCDDGASVVADHRLVRAGLRVPAGARLLRPDAGAGLDAGEGADAGDAAAGKRQRMGKDR